MYIEELKKKNEAKINQLMEERDNLYIKLQDSICQVYLIRCNNLGIAMMGLYCNGGLYKEQCYPWAFHPIIVPPR